MEVFPESLLSDSDQNSLDWRRDFIKTYLERDIPQLGPRIPAETLERIKSPKIYVRDSGITHALLNISDYNSLIGHPVVGGSWEGSLSWVYDPPQQSLQEEIFHILTPRMNY